MNLADGILKLLKIIKLILSITLKISGKEDLCPGWFFLRLDWLVVFTKKVWFVIFSVSIDCHFFLLSDHFLFENKVAMV